MSRASLLTIDGPAGVGKTTVGRRVARALRLPFIDTGLVYRALTAAAAEAGLEGADEAGLSRLAGQVRIQLNPDPDDHPGWYASVNGRPLGLELWDPGRATLLAAVASQPNVRRLLLPAQGAPAGRGAVAVGRDTGTVVFPQAACKVYLDARPEIRLARREGELRNRGLSASDQVMRDEVTVRDRTDLARMARAPEALVIDTSEMGVDRVIKEVLDAWRRAIAAGT